jgi:phosphate-selective porin OprO/OprP
MAGFCGSVALALAMTLPDVVLAQTATTPSSSSATDAQIKAIEDQIRALQQELERVKADLRAKDEQLKQAAEQNRQTQEQLQATTAKVESEKPLVTFPGGRPTFTSEDGQYSLAIGAQVQFDAGAYFQGESNENVQPPGARDLNNGVNLRRGRLYFVAKMGDFALNITPDFGGSPDGSVSLYEANLNYTGFKPLTITLGYFKPWLTLQDSMSSNDFLFLERPSIIEIARGVAAGDSRASFGAKASGDDYFAALYLTGSSFGAQNANLLNDEQTGGTVRLATRPFRGEDWNTHIGFSGSYVFHLNENDAAASGQHQTIQLRDRPELRIDMNRLIDTGVIPASSADTYGIELGANWRNFLVQAEYERIDVDQNQLEGPSPVLHFQGGYIEGSWVITGESRPYNTSAAAWARPVPEHPFSLDNGGWGAWEIAVRYSIADLNSEEHNNEPASATGGVFGGLQQVYSIALSWYPINQVRFQLQFSHVDVNRRSADDGVTQIGQQFEDIAFRSQIAF